MLNKNVQIFYYYSTTSYYMDECMNVGSWGLPIVQQKIVFRSYKMSLDFIKGQGKLKLKINWAF